MIDLAAIEKSYQLGGRSIPVLRGLELHVSEGELLALTGVSGSGKSTLLGILGCLDRPDRGSYRLDRRDVAALGSDELAHVRNRAIGFVFQNFHLRARMQACASVAEPLVYRGLPSAARLAAAVEALGSVGMHDKLAHKPEQLSGGQRQRVAIARAIVGRPRLLLADEPTGSLDSAAAEEILDLLLRLNAEHGMTMIIVTHDAAVASRCRRVVVLQDGRIVDDRSAPRQRRDAAA